MAVDRCQSREYQRGCQQSNQVQRSGLIPSVDHYAYQAPQPSAADAIGPESETNDSGPALTPELPIDPEPATAHRFEVLDGSVMAEN